MARHRFLDYFTSLPKHKAEKILNCINDTSLLGFAVYRVAEIVETVCYSDGVPSFSGHTMEEYEEQIKYDAVDSVFPGDRQLVMHTMQACIETGTDQEISFRRMHVDGGKPWVRMRITKLGEDRGAPLVFAAFLNTDQETRLQTKILEMSNVVCYVIDMDSYALLLANRAALEFSGDPDADYAGVPCYRLLRGYDAPCPDCQLTGESGAYSGEWTDARTGRKYCVKNQIARWQERRICIGNLIDQTELRNSIERQRIFYEMEMRLFSDVNPNALGVVHMDLTTNRCQKSRIVKLELPNNLEGISVDTFLMMIDRLLPEEERKAFCAVFSRDGLLESYRRGELKKSIDHRIRMQDGSIHFINSCIHMITNPATKNVEAVMYAVDINRQKLHEMIIQKITDQDYESISLISVKNRTIEGYFFQSFAGSGPIGQVLDYDREYRNKISKQLTPDARWLFFKATAFETVLLRLNRQDSFSVTITVPAEDNKKHYKQIKYSYLGTTRDFILMQCSDVTELVCRQRQQIDALNEALNEARAANSAKSEFYSRMSHDIRTPMNAIIGITALAKEETHEPEVVRASLEQIESAGKFLLGLVNDILDMAKIEEGGIRLTSERYDTVEFIKNMRTMFAPLCAQKGVQLVLMEPEANLCVMTDRVRLNQIFYNVLSNAIKFTPEGGTVSFRKENQSIDGACVSADYVISDTGIGMSDSFQKHMFEPFEQETRQVTSDVHGTGLGLSITKKLVDLMGGAIQIESHINAGTTVTIHLPFRMAAGESASKTGDEALPTEEEIRLFSGRRALLVEDHPLNMAIGRKLLERRGISVSGAENGALAVKRFSESPLQYYDWILMDIRMPEMDGLTAARTIRALERADAKTVPIVAMTANAYEEDIKKSLAAGMNGHLSKPVDPETLYATLRKVLPA